MQKGRDRERRVSRTSAVRDVFMGVKYRAP
jgi:hypothetical protein